MDDPYDLKRFEDAQDAVFDRVIAELSRGAKTSHWMWFIFPQIAGLGHSPMAQRYAIGGRAEAVAYAAHPVLGKRLRQCTALVNAIEGRTVHQIFGSPDDLKFHSSMTLFAACANEAEVFHDALERFFGGARDPMTSSRL